MEQFHEIPKVEGIEQNLYLLKEGYEYIFNRRKKLQSDLFETRILGKKVVCIGGKEATKIFYDETKFERNQVAPNRIIQTLFGKNAVQTLDGTEHKNRKAMLMSVMTKEQIDEFLNIFKLQWEAAIDRWKKQEMITFYDEMKKLLCNAVFKWIGYPIEGEQLKIRTKEISSMFEAPVAFGPKHWYGKLARSIVENDLGEIVENLRNQKIQVDKNSILYNFTFYQDENNEFLPKETVVVELLNIIRPTIAIAVYSNFIVLTLEKFPKEKEKLKMFSDYGEMFVHEIRRFYPFFPFVAAKVKNNFEWNGYLFEEGTIALLDLYGTNRDPNLWENADEFRPERFSQKAMLNHLIPQGGGSYEGHRCAGEQLTIEVMKVCVDYLVNKMDYTLPEQELTLSMNTIPCIPKSKIIMANIKRKEYTIH